MKMKINELRRAVRKLILEFGENDAQLRKKLQNREKMIGVGMDMGTIGFDPNWDYATDRPMKEPSLGYLIDELMPILGLLEGDPMYEEIEILPKHGGGGAPGMFYFKYNGVKARADHKPHWAKDFDGDILITSVAPEAVKFEFEEGCNNNEDELIELLDGFMEWVDQNG